MIELAGEKGYSFIGVNSNAANAFFVRKDLEGYLPKCVLEDEEFPQYQYRQARDEKGRLLYLSSDGEKELVEDMQVLDLFGNKMIKIKDL